jgi:site-specific DNA-methyltransferase (adenine-specific)
LILCNNTNILNDRKKELFRQGEKAVFYTDNQSGYIEDTKGDITILNKRIEFKHKTSYDNIKTIKETIKQFKYDWIYQKSHAVGFLNCKKQPLGDHEIVSVFNSKVYYPQLLDKPKQNIRPKTLKPRLTDSYGNFKHGDTRTIPLDKTYPKSVIKFNRDQKKFHPTQKPVPLLEYLIKTYTLENETVLDFTMGSGSTGVACKNLNRNFIGIEKDDNYFEIAKKRIFEQIN